MSSASGRGRERVVTAGLMLGLLGAYHLVAQADGAPTATPIYYSGTLTDGGVPIDGMRNLRVSLWRDASGSATTMRACETIADNTMFTGGRFRVALDETCVTAMRTTPELFVQVEVAGTTIGTRTRIGAVPYALEADHSVRASGAVPGSELAFAAVPAGAVMAFDLATCPTGWTAYAPAAGRTVVGTDTALTRGMTVGSATATLAVGNMPAHSHTVMAMVQTAQTCDRGSCQAGVGMNSSANIGQFPVTGTTNSVGSGTAFSVRDPSVALLYCRRM